MVTAKNIDHTVTRNFSFFKKISPAGNFQNKAKTDDAEELLLSETPIAPTLDRILNQHDQLRGQHIQNHRPKRCYNMLRQFNNNFIMK